MSTLSAMKEKADDGFIKESFPSERPELHYHSSGYVQSKWVAERLLAQALERGVPVNIYRPGWITGQTATGICAVENNHLLRLIKSCIQLGEAPNWQRNIDMVPADFTRALIVHAVTRSPASGQVYNLVNPHCVSWVELIKQINGLGYKVEDNY